jgi:hypothetical protein
MGVSPAPAPKLIATYPTRAAAIAVGRGRDRDRVVDETGNQTVVFGRRGSRPFTAAEFDAFLRRDGRLYRVEDVAVVDGVLKTASGGALAPAGEFRREPPAAPAPGETGRLTRRPPDGDGPGPEP